MGHKDLVRLHEIYDEIQRLNKEHGWPFQFKVDDGQYETRIDINSDGHCTAGSGNLPLIGYDMYCPDLLDFHNKIIIENEESAKANTGYFNAKKHKGHTEIPNTRDKRRDKYYKLARFHVLKIWDYDKEWKEKLENFLFEKYKEKKLNG